MDMLTVAVASPVVVYVFARLITAAYFKSKQQYEGQYGKKPQQGS